MAGQYRIDFCLLGSAGGAATFYIVAPVDLQILGVQAAGNAIQAGNETITVGEAATDVGVLTILAGAAGSTGTYVADTTNGDRVFHAGDVIKVVISQLGSAATYCGYIDFDPYCRS